jgi:hypothetical protein
MEHLNALRPRRTDSFSVENKSWVYHSSISQWLIEMSVTRSSVSWERILINCNTFEIEDSIGHIQDIESISCYAMGVITRMEYKGKEIVCKPNRYENQIVSLRNKNHMKISWGGRLIDEKIPIPCFEFEKHDIPNSMNIDEQINGYLINIKHKINSVENYAIREIEEFLDGSSD